MSKIISTSNNLQVIYEDNHIIVVNKRVGDIVQGDRTGDIPLSEVVKQYLKRKYNKPGNVYLGVVHRLDRPTTGVILFSKTSKALPRLNKMFVEKTAQKTYWAMVKNCPKKAEDTLTHWLKKNPKNNKSTAHIKEVSGGKKAILHYKLVKKLDQYCLLQIQLKTGRHHQIRSQLAAINCPIKGDLKYGFNRSNKNGGIHLHAKTLKIYHPTTKELMTFEASLPNDNLWNNCVKHPAND